MKFLFVLLLFLCSFTVSAQKKQFDELTWPREITLNESDVTLYQPQLESFENNIIEGRMAVSVKSKNTKLTFGAVLFRATVRTDLDNRVVELEKLNIIQTNFPDVEKEKTENFARLFEDKVEGSSLQMSLDHLLAAMDAIDQQRNLSDNLRNEPPVIYYREKPAVLVMIDGDPILKETDDKNIEYVVNTPYFLVKDKGADEYFLRGGKFWYSSTDIKSGWTSREKVPSDIFKLSEKAMEGYNPDEDSVMKEMTSPPELVVSTKPAELIVVDGEPQYQSIEGTSLLFVENSESDIIMDIVSQEHYVLLAGRWYFSKSLTDEDWKFREPADLPEDFSRIPAGSNMANVRSSVPGTEEAELAVLEQTIPQTATVDRKTATVEVQYDGEPSFSKVTGTSVEYAENADKTVLRVNKKYYCVDDGIWFVSDRPAGPWEVSTERPDEVDDIPPESPVYNVKYVYIYDYTPEVVYVGYTPGYTCSYVYGGVVVYGTGYYYRPWYHTYYYPRPVTYGFSVHYNPWTGWGFSFGFSYGWFSYGWYRPYYSWWGPAGYRYGYRHGYYHGYHHGYNRGYFYGYQAGKRAGYVSANQGRPRTYDRNVYEKRTEGIRTTGVRDRSSTQAGASGRGDRMASQDRSRQPVDRSQVNRNDRTATRDGNRENIQTRPSTRQNDVYAGRDGNVYRKDRSGSVQQRSDGRWNSSSRPGTRDQINRESMSRQQGTQRYNQYNATRSRSTGTRSGGSRSGGAGMRRR